MLLRARLAFGSWLNRPRFVNKMDRDGSGWVLEQPGGANEEEEGRGEEARQKAA